VRDNEYILTLSTYRRYINKCIYLSIYLHLSNLWCLTVYKIILSTVLCSITQFLFYSLHVSNSDLS